MTDVGHERALRCVARFGSLLGVEQLPVAKFEFLEVHHPMDAHGHNLTNLFEKPDVGVLKCVLILADRYEGAKGKWNLQNAQGGHSVSGFQFF